MKRQNGVNNINTHTTECVSLSKITIHTVHRDTRRLHLSDGLIPVESKRLSVLMVSDEASKGKRKKLVYPDALTDSEQSLLRSVT